MNRLPVSFAAPIRRILYFCEKFKANVYSRSDERLVGTTRGLEEVSLTSTVS